MAEEEVPQDETPQKQKKIQYAEMQELPAELVQVLESIPEPEQEEVKKGMLIALSIKKSSFRGPLPPPDLLKGYNDVMPGGAERVMLMAENQAAHRIKMEDRTIGEDQKQSKTGQIMGFIVALVCLLVAGFLSYTGHEAVAGVIGGGTIVSLATIFVLGKINQDKDLSSK